MGFRWWIHFFGIDFGTKYGVWVPYNFWSGVAGSFLMSVLGSALTFGILFYVHHVCTYSRWCVRWGHTQLADGRGRACWRHHPDHKGRRKLRGPALHKAHAEWLAGQ
jgi:hypothetical protein